MYLNANLAKRWNSLVGKPLFEKTLPVYEAVPILIQELGFSQCRNIILSCFPEKTTDIALFDDGKFEDFFSKSQHIRSTLLSPGYMGDCPHRLDGIHDYCTFCRKHNDPGRSDDNMKTYNHDRRAFLWWAEGDWKIADALYNSASYGTCINCGKTVKKISPDHVGPLSCGFQQNAFFEPLCSRCNSTKNRRLVNFSLPTAFSSVFDILILRGTAPQRPNVRRTLKAGNHNEPVDTESMLSFLAFKKLCGTYSFLCNYLDHKWYFRCFDAAPCSYADTVNESFLVRATIVCAPLV